MDVKDSPTSKPPDHLSSEVTPLSGRQVASILYVVIMLLTVQSPTWLTCLRTINLRSAANTGRQFLQRRVTNQVVDILNLRIQAGTPSGLAGRVITV